MTSIGGSLLACYYMPQLNAQKLTDRQQQILEALAKMLQAAPEHKITTAKLASNVGVSEAALYRHFPSKTKMFEALITFAEQTLFVRIHQITKKETTSLNRCAALLQLFLEFCEHNPGITRLLTGSPLAGESRRLHDQVAQFYDRLETQLRQYLRNAELQEAQRACLPISAAANLLIASAEGRVAQYVRSGFKRNPTEGWEDQWSTLTAQFMRPHRPRLG